jgi:hypothetical protein
MRFSLESFRESEKLLNHLALFAGPAKDNPWANLRIKQSFTAIEPTGTEARLYRVVGAVVPAGQVSERLYMTLGERLLK